MVWLRNHWWVPLLGVAVCAIAIFAMAPRYTDAQLAHSATAFYDAVADAGKDRTTAAGLVDIVFVAAYFTTALALSRPNLVSRIGLGVMGVAAIADMVENTLVVVGVRTGDATDGYVDAIRGFGAVKWSGVVVGALLMLVGLRTREPAANR